MIKYRPDVDGLRALAIIPVVLYHTDVPGVSGGYVGVDVFFVISGYLIGSIILSDIDAGRFSILRFYERRVRRILPALLVVLAATTLAAWAIMLPIEFARYPPSLAATVLFASNMLFWSRAGYFAAPAETEPLLHTWSIAIEEQFYLFVPGLLILLCRFAPRHLGRWLPALALLSFLLCVALTRFRPEAAFYLLPTRAWELFVGLWLAAIPAAKVPQRGATTLAWSGLVAVAASVATFSPATPFPGYAALLPVAGTALILRFAPGTPVARALGWGPLVFIGLISYSLYLWHWPLIAFGRILGVLDASALAKAAVIGLSFVIAIPSWYLIERPFREKRRIGRRRVFGFAAAGSAILLTVGFATHALDGWPQRFPARAVAMDRGRMDFSPYRAACHREAGLTPIAHSCTLGRGRASVAVWGDSHGVELSAALTEAGRSVLTVTYSACPPALGFESPTSPQCDEHNLAALRFFETQPEIDTIILTAKWERWGSWPGFNPGMEAVIRRLQRAGKNVLVIGPVPKQRHLSEALGDPGPEGDGEKRRQA